MGEPSQETWPEQGYLECLEHERHMFAWTLHRFGGMPANEAEGQALQHYPYQPPDHKFRGLVMHDQAWHWAMLMLHGDGYWRTNPDLQHIPAEYEQESDRFEDQQRRGGDNSPS